jgi:hypothetical protein
MKIRNLALSSCLGVISLIGVTTNSFAFSIAAPGTEGLSVFVTSTDDIVGTYLGNSASYSNDLYLDTSSGPIFGFNNHASLVGSQVNFGSFAVGSELIFRLHVNDTNQSYFTGSANRNPDGNYHARVQNDWEPNTTLVSFEDLHNGPFSYNDLSFSFKNTSTQNVPAESVPSPAAGWLFMSSLIIFARRFTHRRMFERSSELV